MGVAVEVRGIVNRFGKQTVHRGLDMRVCEGEIFGIVGGSGSGKSVLLRTILGLQRPQQGTVLLQGRDITRMSGHELRAVKAGYGVTFQQGALYSSLTVLQNIQLPMIEHLSLTPRQLDELAVLKLRLVGLSAEAAHKYPAFLDEPTSGLDPISAAAFDELLLYLQRELQLTVVMITHDLDTIFRICNRVGVIVEGRMISDTLAGIVHNKQPWIKAYFQGERARVREGRHGA
jgi:phospholipid/cholesterol/gamma-HCH transport system ATP-binding protein